MKIHYYLIAASGILNAVFGAYADITSTYTPPTWLQALGPAIVMALFPCCMMAFAARERTRISGLLATCAVLTLLSGLFFGYLYVTENDSSRVFLFGAHWVLTFIFAFISLFSPRETPLA